ncbi:Alpha/Beta hydrolase protein [Chaetomidium leptoderma]|uniref:Alpha/Beta hydrolase protein n=1 Tax=Chaetomidium leptoderma TaxID=669021 RepID=A0AAN6VD57_9PEZI|nr:Alpha/Beta hydrolase protein [Chaetomidium leptoderma]
MCDFSSYGGPSDEWLALEATLPAPAAGLSIAERKAATNALRESVSAEAMKTLGPQLQIHTHTIPTRDGSRIQARSYRPLHTTGTTTTNPLPVYMHLHGGGFLFGTLSSEDAACARIAISTGVVVLNVDYRHTPEHVYPVAWNDTEDAFEWLHDNMSAVGGGGGGDAQRVVVGGISAGAYLGASLALQKHLGRVRVAGGSSRPAIAGLVLMIPSVVHIDCYAPQMAKLKGVEVSSWETCKDAPVLPRAVCSLFMDLLKVEGADVSDTRLNPGNASVEQVKGLPPTVFGVAGNDPLRDEGLLFAKMLTEAGVPTDVNLFQGVPHGFRRYGDALSECKRWDQVIENGIAWALSGPEATGVFEIKTE